MKLKKKSPLLAKLWLIAQAGNSGGGFFILSFFYFDISSSISIEFNVNQVVKNYKNIYYFKDNKYQFLTNLNAKKNISAYSILDYSQCKYKTWLDFIQKPSTYPKNIDPWLEIIRKIGIEKKKISKT